MACFRRGLVLGLAFAFELDRGDMGSGQGFQLCSLHFFKFMVSETCSKCLNAFSILRV